MDTNVQALKGLYAALGGEAADVADLQTSSEVITALEAVAAAAATELPAVAKKDAGKTLTVNGNGKWAAIMPEDVIDDSEASETKTYSSSKIASLIPANELPAVSASDNGKLLGVKSGAWSAVESKTIVVPITISNSVITIKSSSPLATLGDICAKLQQGFFVVLVEEGTGLGMAKVFYPHTFGGISQEVYFQCIQYGVSGSSSLTMYYTQGLVVSSVNLAIAT